MLSPFNGDWSVHSTESDVMFCCFVLLHPSFANPNLIALIFRLFQTIFKDLMLLQFLNVLLQALVYRSHDLLQEEITITLYNMAAVDFDSFYSAFLPRFLGGCEGLTDSQKTELGKNFTPDKVIAVNNIIMNKISDTDL